jgi:uncharacterized membrane protein
MEFWGTISLYIHIIAGTLTLLAGPIAIFYNGDNTKLHKVWGKIFLWAMGIVTTTAIFGFIQHPTHVFFQFLGGLSLIVIFNLYKAIRAIQFRKKLSVSNLDKVVFYLSGMVAFLFTGMAFYGFIFKNGGAVYILLMVFGLALFLDLRGLLRLVRNESTTAKNWFKQHIGGMLGAFTASTTAFMVNVDSGLPWYLAWFGPAIIIQPLVFYFFKKYRLNDKPAKEKGIPNAVVD